MSYGILTPGLVQEAYEMVYPLIEATLANRAKRQHLAIVVTATSAILETDTNKSFQENCLFTASIGEEKKWEYEYDVIALSKAEKSARTGKGSAELAPHYLIDGDTIYWGSVVLDDIVVACSGVEPYYDELFSMWIASAIKALAKKRFAELSPDAMFIS